MGDMKAKSIRVSEEMLEAVKLVEEKEHIKEATAIRKLIRVGFESYVAGLYRRGEITLMEAARRLNMSQSETVDLFLDAGVTGNLDASDVAASIDAFVGS